LNGNSRHSYIRDRLLGNGDRWSPDIRNCQAGAGRYVEDACLSGHVEMENTGYGILLI